uniref:Cytochrome b5 heme-binding domain-containing protein n=1 Tax=Hyaloperonospora arabidopsidis (strain Emoy2) TaxID=559515 RepID=M4BE02_HYAAE
MEHYLVTSGYKCPYPFSVLLRDKSVEKEATVTASGLPTYTLDQLRLYDGSDEEKPLLLAVGGKVLDVTSGAKFYGKGQSYHIFAGKDLNDDVSDFSEKHKKELAETKAFYYEKYPILATVIVPG